MNEEKKVPFKWEYGEETISLQLGMYANNQRLYIGMITHTEDGAEPFADMTVNLPGYSLDPGEAFISGDISKDLLRFIKENKLGKVLPYQVQSGYGKYSAVAFDLEKLKAFDPKGVAEFRKEWNLPDKKPVKKKSRKTIYQDSKGYIWIGTDDGLNRYNGYEFKHYNHDEYNKNSIANNYICDIAEDKNGYIWVSTTNGLSRIDTDKDEIKNYYSEKDNGNLLDSNIWRILYTREGKLIVFGINGVNLYDEEKDTFNSIMSKSNELQSQYIYSVKEDSNGHIWVGTNKGLIELDKDLNLVKHYKDTIGNFAVYNVYDDSKGSLWVCTLGNGLFRINLNDKTIKNYKNSTSEFSISSDKIGRAHV